MMNTDSSTVIVFARRRLLGCLSVLILFVARVSLVRAKGLVGKLPGNPASCPEEPCNSDPQHVLYALKWTSLGFGVILLLPLLMYYMSKLISKIHSLCSRKVNNKSDSDDDTCQVSTKQQLQLQLDNTTASDSLRASSNNNNNNNNLEANNKKRKSIVEVSAAVGRRASQINGKRSSIAQYEAAQQLAQKLNLEERNRQLAQLIVDSEAIMERCNNNQPEQQAEPGDDQHGYAVCRMSPNLEQQLNLKMRQQEQQSSSSSSRAETHYRSGHLVKVYPQQDSPMQLSSYNLREEQQSTNANDLYLSHQMDGQQKVPQISLVSQLYHRHQQQQQQQQCQIQQNNNLRLPSSGSQHRHSIDAAFLNRLNLELAEASSEQLELEAAAFNQAQQLQNHSRHQFECRQERRSSRRELRADPNQTNHRLLPVSSHELAHQRRPSLNAALLRQQ